MKYEVMTLVFITDNTGKQHLIELEENDGRESVLSRLPKDDPVCRELIIERLSGEVDHGNVLLSLPLEDPVYRKFVKEYLLRENMDYCSFEILLERFRIEYPEIYREIIRHYASSRDFTKYGHYYLVIMQHKVVSGLCPVNDYLILLNLAMNPTYGQRTRSCYVKRLDYEILPFSIEQIAVNDKSRLCRLEALKKLNPHKSRLTLYRAFIREEDPTNRKVIIEKLDQLPRRDEAVEGYTNSDLIHYEATCPSMKHYGPSRKHAMTLVCGGYDAVDFVNYLMKRNLSPFMIAKMEQALF